MRVILSYEKGIGMYIYTLILMELSHHKIGKKKRVCVNKKIMLPKKHQCIQKRHKTNKLAKRNIRLLYKMYELSTSIV